MTSKKNAEVATLELSNFNPDGSQEDERGVSSLDEDVKPWGKLVKISNNPCMIYDVIELKEDEITMGRSENCDYVFKHPVVSSHHCTIRRERVGGSKSNDSVVWVEDYSTNKTYINHEPIGKGKKKILQHASSLELMWKGKSKNDENISFIFQDCCATESAESTEGAPYDRYILREVLGTGNFATVKMAIHKETSQSYAIKIIDKKKFMLSNVTKRKNALLDEVKILSKLQHPNIIGIKEMIDTETTLYLVLELVTGGELFDKIINAEKFTESQARNYFQQMLDATKYLHGQGVAHRDLKPENILLKDDVSDVIKLSDFGLSRMVDQQSFMKTICGTPQYVAPEILSSAAGGVGYGLACDLWSLGVILYIMLAGYPPFNDTKPKTVFQQIKEADFDFPDEFWAEISESAKDLIRRLLTVDPNKRITVDQALEAPWVKGMTEVPDGFYSEIDKQQPQDDLIKRTRNADAESDSDESKIAKEKPKNKKGNGKRKREGKEKEKSTKKQKVNE